MTKDGTKPRAKKVSKDRPRRVVIYLPPQLAKRLLVRCAEHDRSISDVGVEAIERYLLVTS
jgi:hypothetical protein